MNTEIRYLTSLLENPVETDKTDYKSAEPFQKNSDFSIKLIKHILAFANSGGGHIVIGFREASSNKSLVIDEKLNDKVILSYDVTKVSQKVNSVIGNQDRIELSISKVPFNKKIFAIIYISPFKKRPYFCKSTICLSSGEAELEEGTIYIRVPGAQTVKVAGVGDWDKLISQCIEAEYETFLKRAKDVLAKLYPKATSLPIALRKPVLKDLEEARKEFLKKTKR